MAEYFEISTVHLGILKVMVGGPALAIPEHRSYGPSEQSQIAAAKMIHKEPALLLQTYDTILDPENAALLQAIETTVYFASEMPLSGDKTGLSIWGITIINFIGNI